MRVEVIVPLRTNGCPHREAAWRFCRERHAYPVVVAPGTEPWNKGLAVMLAVERSKADIIVMCDADCHSDGLPEAVQAVADGAPWSRPHQLVVRLSQTGTEAYMGGARWQECDLDQRPYHGVDGGGILVLPRETFLRVPMDARFTGWGQEDHAWGLALHDQLGPCTRGDFPLIHLWHPHPERVNRKMGNQEGWNLFRRYCHARRSPAEMESLLQEARESYRSHQQALHDHSAHVLGQR